MLYQSLIWCTSIIKYYISFSEIVRIYDGNGSLRKRVYRTVAVPKNAPVSVLLVRMLPSCSHCSLLSPAAPTSCSHCSPCSPPSLRKRVYRTVAVPKNAPVSVLLVCMLPACSLLSPSAIFFMLEMNDPDD